MVLGIDPITLYLTGNATLVVLCLQWITVPIFYNYTLSDAKISKQKIACTQNWPSVSFKLILLLNVHCVVDHRRSQDFSKGGSQCVKVRSPPRRDFD